MVIGVAMDYRDPKTVLKFVNSMSISYPIVFGDKKIASQIGPVSMLPTTYLFDPAGKPAAYKVGIISREDLEEFMRENPVVKPKRAYRRENATKGQVNSGKRQDFPY